MEKGGGGIRGENENPVEFLLYSLGVGEKGYFHSEKFIDSCIKNPKNAFFAQPYYSLTSFSALELPEMMQLSEWKKLVEKASCGDLTAQQRLCETFSSPRILSWSFLKVHKSGRERKISEFFIFTPHISMDCEE